MMGKYWWDGIDMGEQRGEWGKQELLALLDNYLKGTAYGSSGADVFAVSAPSVA
jgi:hypothetical protein